MHFPVENVIKQTNDIDLVKYVAEVVLIGPRMLVDEYKYFNFCKG